MPELRWLGALIIGFAVLSLGSVARSSAEEKQFGPFLVDTVANSIRLNGEIDAAAALNFRRALAALPDANAVLLNSPGGEVHVALLIADEIYERGLGTEIPLGSACYSACAYIFLAGRERVVEGQLGVHQISSDAPDLVSAQVAISDIIDMLNRFGTPAEVLTVMFRTPPNEMYVFPADEVERYQINRRAAGERTPGNAPGIPPSIVKWLRQQQEEPANRIAMYVGLDFYGGDIRSSRFGDAGRCATECVGSGQCRAFTYNSDPRRRKGPNCFLKNSLSRFDGNEAAISGVLLSVSEPDPEPLTIDVIEPGAGVLKDTDIPGRDLFQEPFAGASTGQQCRFSCVSNSQCKAFTFVIARRECWLKQSAEGAQPREGMISGIKQTKTYSPAEIVEVPR